jgi:hypothetical protein
VHGSADPHAATRGHPQLLLGRIAAHRSARLSLLGRGVARLCGAERVSRAVRPAMGMRSPPRPGGPHRQAPAYRSVGTQSPLKEGVRSLGTLHGKASSALDDGNSFSVWGRLAVTPPPLSVQLSPIAGRCWGCGGDNDRHMSGLAQRDEPIATTKNRHKHTAQNDLVHHGLIRAGVSTRLRPQRERRPGARPPAVGSVPCPSSVRLTSRTIVLSNGRN